MRNLAAGFIIRGVGIGIMLALMLSLIMWSERSWVIALVAVIWACDAAWLRYRLHRAEAA